jgi:pilus assembly protein CpaE
MALALAISCPFSAISDMEMDGLRQARPELVAIDLEGDPHEGIAFSRQLLESGIASAVVAAHPEPTQEILLDALQSGLTEVLTKPLDEERIRDALQRVLRRAGRLTMKVEEEERAPGRVLAFVGAKGGVGTTALATNVAVEIHRITGKRTLLLDLDMEQGETAILLGMNPQFSLLDLLRNYQPVVSGLLASCIDTDEDSGIDLLAAPLQSGVVQSEDLELLSGDSMREVLDFLRKHYDYIVVDRPKSFHPAFNCVLEEADETFLITTPDLQALRNITRSISLLRNVAGSSEKKPIHMVVNRYPPNHPVPLKEIEELVGLDVYHSLGADFFPINESMHEGTPAVLRESSQFSRDVQQLSARITGTGDDDGRRKGLLGGILKAVRDR